MCWKKAKNSGEHNDCPDNKIIETFSIPTEGNSITNKDIQQGIIRITKENKRFFPSYDCNVQIKIGDRTFTVEYKLRNNEDKARSHLLKLGHAAMEHLKVKSGDNLFVERVDEESYIISK